MSDDAQWALLLLGPAGATGLYWTLYRHYRNTDKSHAFEHETEVETQPATGSDAIDCTASPVGLTPRFDASPARRSPKAAPSHCFT